MEQTLRSEEIRYRSFNKEDTVVAYKVFPPAEIKAIGIIQIVHGMAEHMERYRSFAKLMAGKGFIVCGNDHVGHGKTAQIEDRLGYFGEQEPGIDTLIEDIRYLHSSVAKENPTLPYIIFGHSMGSFVSRIYVSKYGENIDGFIISGTSGKVGPGNIMAKTGKSLVKANIKRNGSRFRSSFIDGIAFGAYNSKVKSKETPFDWLTRDKTEVLKYLEDEKCGFVFTNNGFLTLFGLIERANDKFTFRNTRAELPIFLISGAMDPVGDKGKGVREVFENYKKAGVKNIQIKLYPEARHELLNELNQEEVKQDILNWILEII